MGRASFASGTNALNADSGIKKTTVSGNIYNTVTGGTCSNVSTGEKGVMPITAFNAASVVKSKYVSSAIIRFDFPDAKGLSVKNFEKNTDSCSDSPVAATIQNVYKNMNYSRDSSGKESWTTGTGGNIPASVMIAFQWRPRSLINGSSFTVNDPSKTLSFTTGTCYKKYQNDSNVLIDAKTSVSQLGSSKFGSKTFTISASISGTPTVTTTNCPTLTNNAGSALVRPYVKVKASDIIMRNNAKRTYSQSAVLNTSAIPTSDNAGSFLTLQTSALSVVLNSGTAGVVGNVYEVEKPKTGTTISLPVYFGTANLTDGTDSTRYVSAE